MYAQGLSAHPRALVRALLLERGAGAWMVRSRAPHMRPERCRVFASRPYD